MNKQLNSKEKILIAQTQLKFNTEMYSKEKVKKEQRNKTMEKLCNKKKQENCAHQRHNKNNQMGVAICPGFL